MGDNSLEILPREARWGAVAGVVGWVGVAVGCLIKVAASMAPTE